MRPFILRKRRMFESNPARMGDPETPGRAGIDPELALPSVLRPLAIKIAGAKRGERAEAGSIRGPDILEVTCA